MSQQFLTDEEVRRGYHSGLSGKTVLVDKTLDDKERFTKDKTIRFTTGKYTASDFRVTLRTDKNDWNDLNGTFDPETSQWIFHLPAATYGNGFKMKFVLADTSNPDVVGFWMSGDDVDISGKDEVVNFDDGRVVFSYDVKFKTEHWHPNHLVTLRNNIDGWGRDIFGVFRGDSWHFSLDRDIYPAAFNAKFVLDRTTFMDGDDLLLSVKNQYNVFDDTEISFAAKPLAFPHGYDNFSSIENPIEQMTVQSVGREYEQFDVIVIGSGMGGGVLADALSDKGVKVLVLEAGGIRMPVHMNELPRSETSLVGRDQLGHFNFTGTATWFASSGVHFNLGGRSVYWSGLIPQMQPWEFRDAWPPSVRDYLLHQGGYDAAEKVMRKQKFFGRYQDDVVELLNKELGDEFIATDLPRSMHQPDLDTNAQLRNVIQRSTGGFSSADLLLDSLGFSDQAGKNNLRVNLHHLVKQIETNDDQVTHVVCEDLIGKKERRYQASFVVLACGSIESPKLALESKLRDPNEKIGKGLTDHSAYFYKNLHELPTQGSKGWLGDPHGHAKVMIRNKNASVHAHAYNIELLINAKYWDARHADDDLWRRRIDNGETALVEIKFIFDTTLKEHNYITANGIGKKPDVCVAINDICDAYKQEIVTVRNRILEVLGVKCSTTHFDSREWNPGIYGSVHHAGGTLRMSHDGSGVVDETLKFEAYQNLYCCDVSVNPTIPAANPSLTLVALALRLADTLKARVNAIA